jgi:SAM-dependent methyltransferase
MGVRPLARRVRNALLYRGDRYTCPVCERPFGRFKAGPRGRPDAYCPACGSAERHRLLWLFLRRELELPHTRARVLHVAPEPAIGARLRAAPDIDYVSTDLNGSIADVQADLTRLPFEDAAFDVVICNHVLEHIPDDVAAMRELRRVLSERGVALLQHPIDAGRARTLEDWTADTPAAREETFFQHDHVRIYGRDFAERLRTAGFARVEPRRYRDAVPPAEVERFGLDQAPSNKPERDIEADVIYVCRP